MNKLMRVYYKLKEAYGPQKEWWPGETPFHIALGAILTQNTTWTSAYKALQNLIRAGIDTPEMLEKADIEKVKTLIKPAGFMNQKAQYLKNLAYFVCKELHGDIENLRFHPSPRQALLSVKGIGKETADSILLYGLHLPYFVVDAYTRRIFSRLGIINTNNYDLIAKIFTDNIPKDIDLYKEYHALIVEHAKNTCTKQKPKCYSCPLKDLCPLQMIKDQHTQDR